VAQAKVINIEDAKLKTLSVEIKAMTVNGKQMTLSTFRQLPEEILITDEGKLKGVPWGIVRYFWGDQSKDGIHVVWQDGSNLYRSFYESVDTLERNRRFAVTCKDEYEWLKRGAHWSTYTPKTWLKSVTKNYAICRELVDARMKELSVLESTELVKYDVVVNVVRTLNQLPQLFIAV
jgi:hypothetical protein